ALVGAVLPGGLTIQRTAVRGVDSDGMLCSARELGLSEDTSGLLELDDDATPGASLRELLGLDDSVFVLKLTPNRADCLSLLGVAREVAALTGAALTVPACVPVVATIDDRLPVAIDPAAHDLCGRFAGRVIRGVDARVATPAWIRQRLERAGQRSISALVDISNYVMLELGQPSHVFDLDRIRHGRLGVRWARDGEHAQLLNDQTVALTPDFGVITDGDEPEAVAGVMGGSHTAVSLDTRNLYLEAAFWWPAAIAGRARRLNFTTEAGHRFERGVDFSNAVTGLERITSLILSICGGAAGPVDDQVLALPDRSPVALRVARCNRVIGITFTTARIGQIFDLLGFTWQVRASADGDVFDIMPPAHRFDLALEEDFIEEVIRIHGYDKLPAVPPSAPAWMRALPEACRAADEIRDALVGRDYSEAVNFGFVDPQWEADFAGAQRDAANAPIALLNPISSQLAVMRSTLIGGLVANVRHNVNRKQSRVRLFELGRVFQRAADVADGPLAVAGIAQPLRLAAIAHGDADPEQWGIKARSIDFFDMKADLEAIVAPRVARFAPAPHPALHPGRSARVMLDGHAAGWLGELHPRWQQRYELPAPTVLFELDWSAVSAGALPMLAEVSRFPPVRRDLAFIVDRKVTAQAMIDAVMEAPPPFVERFEVFDSYVGMGIESGEKSLAFRVLLQDTRKTLTDGEVESSIARLVEIIANRQNGRLRQ
ncbi:MAG: phenylalanine--tRNA ligase subunit beta, partial [Proteobacteria bacterium]|nr:phenylalanine--tRNA ligase subunit beta [Burkholderiales bacterium]